MDNDAYLQEDIVLSVTAGGCKSFVPRTQILLVCEDMPVTV